MKTFIVLRREVHVAHIEVRAESEDEAIKIVKDDGGEEIYMEYSHTMGTETWDIEEK